MIAEPMDRRTPPRFVVKTTVATLIMVAGVLTAVFVGVAVNVRERVRGAVADKLEAGQRMLSELEHRRARELNVQVATLAENPTLKNAVANYEIERQHPQSPYLDGMRRAIARELDKLASRIGHDVVAVTDRSGAILAASGRRNRDWPVGSNVRAQQDDAGLAYVSMPAGVFQFASTPLTLQETPIGTLQLARAFDERYARELSALSGTATLITSRDAVIASTLPSEVTQIVRRPDAVRALPKAQIVDLGGSEYAIKLLFEDGDAKVYAVDSIAASTRAPMQDALRAVLIIAIGAFALAACASLWLAQTISRPIDELSKSVAEMTTTRAFDTPVPPTGSSLEVDTLTESFNTMLRTVTDAEAATQSAYVGAIRALALALDARDPYTAGHSERVGVISVAIGRQMDLPEDQLDILRLGSLLHDIGKIGISDAVLRKPGALTAEEYELVKEHPGVGARILKSIHFLAPHVPIVEYHHERPDGLGYPHRLRGDEIPLSARIVHVADAFDAMTSARAYRRARAASDALRELWRYSGTQFDADVVQALALAIPTIEMPSPSVQTPTYIPAARLAFARSVGRA
jgi:HD-GYP domain-containing protein (c-di-GMP phosphodiesterase class II)